MDNLELKKALLIVDGSALAYRAFYGIKPLSNSSGQQTQAIFGFFKSLIKTVEKFKNCELIVVVAWDSRTSKRKTVYQDYKANRLAMPQDLSSQFAIIKEICELSSIEQLSVEGLEADDLIFSYAAASELPVIIVSPDKDLLQLVGGQTFVYDPTVDILYDAQEVIKKFQMPPTHLQLYHALLGDSSDNIPGVAGIGKKTALEVAQKFQTPQQVLEKISELPAKISSKILADQQNFLLSFQLFGLIKTPVELGFLNNKPFTVQDLFKAQNKFQELEIKTLFGKRIAQESEAQKTLDDSCYQGLAFVDVQSTDDLLPLMGVQAIAVDTETTGLDWKTEKLLAITMSDGTNNFWIDVATPKIKEIAAWLDKNIFANPGVTKAFHNAKFDLHFLANNLGIDWKTFTPIFDTLICAQILASGSEEKIDLKSLARRHFGLVLPSYKDLLAAKITMHDPSGKVNQLFQKYAVMDALVCHKLMELFKGLLAGEQKSLFYNIETPILTILTTLETQGIKIDRAQLDKLSTEVQQALETVEQKLRSALEAMEFPSWQETNFLSPKQVGELLFGFLNLDRFLSVNEKPSTEKETLEYLSKFHPVPKMITQLRALSKLKSTYLEGFLKHIWSDCKVHTSYGQTNVTTGRLSSENPNLQNLPLDIDENNEKFFGYRSIFVADPGKVLVSVDYSQIELRVLAHITKDPILTQAFCSGQDVHSTTAKEIFNVPLESVSKEQRQIGKRINFGIIYGLGAFGLSQQLEIPRGQAQEYIETFFSKYTGVRTWIDKTIEFAHTNGFVQTMFGRKRVFSQINDRNTNLQKSGERMAVNCVIQGSAAEIVKLAMIAVQKLIDDQFPGQADMLLQVHDELVFQVETGKKEEFCVAVKLAMESVTKLDVPLEVDLSSGPNLLDLN